MPKQQTGLKIQYVNISYLHPADYNPRKWDESAIKRLKESIKRFGVVDPILANSAPKRKNIIIGGHFRWSVAKEMGFKVVPVVYLNIPDIEKEKELNLRLNRNTGEWDYELLKSWDIDLLQDIGFDDNDISAIWDDSLETEEDNFDVEKELQKIKKPKTKPGDMYQLGNHRLICGDSTKEETLQKLLGKNRISMIYTDPPYNISLDYNKGIGNKKGYGGKTNDSKTDKDYKIFLDSTLINALHFATKDCHVFYYCDEKYIGMIQNIFEENKLTNRRVCLWLKNNQNPVPQVAFNKVYEPCVYATQGTPYLSSTLRNLNEVLNKEVGTGNNLIDDVFDLFNIWIAKRIAGSDYEHPTEKPPTLHEKAIRRCTKLGDPILDLFGGSGSTLIACEQLKRKAFLVEMEPIFCDLIVRRYEKLTHTKAKLL